MLAPTGKARVRLETQTGLTGALTIAQFLSEYDRYSNGRYFITGSPKTASGFYTLIVDEASMMTDEQFGAILDATRGGTVERLILVGDPRQLPPIGPGRPFVDIVNFLKPDDIDGQFPRVSKGYGELTVGRRQKGRERADVRLAKYFSGEKITVSEEEIFARAPGIDDEHLKLVRWDTEEQLDEIIEKELETSLNLKAGDRETQFETSLGGTEFKGRVYFRQKYKDHPGAASKAEEWQILSPVRPGASGVEAINRRVQTRFRKKVWDWINVEHFYHRKITSPLGAQRILYGDKVINLTNSYKSDVFPKKDKGTGYVANGDIGIVVGQYKGQNSAIKGLPWKAEVEFASQLGHKYGFHPREFGEEAVSPLELAYALTIHKSQGSQFGIVFLILPNPCWLLSRELIYTALTRQQNKIVILHQGEWDNYRVFADSARSDIASRFTNTFYSPSPVEVKTDRGKKFLEQHLIHTTLRGDLVRSKSEVVIANSLFQSGIKDYQYEPTFVGRDGKTRYPDFLIVDQDSGQTYVWEHLGMLTDRSYAEKWEAKKKWYSSNGVLPPEEGEGSEGVLIVTRDDESGGIDSLVIKKAIDRIKGA